MKSAILLWSSLAATCYSAAVPVSQRDALVARDDQSGKTVTVIVTITSTTTRSSSTRKIDPTQTGTVVFVTITSTVTKSSTHPVVTAPPVTTPVVPWGPWNSGFHPPWWSSWLTQGNPVTVTDTIGLGPVTVYSPIYITVTATDPDDNMAATVTLPALTRSVAAREESHRPGHHTSDWHPGYTSIWHQTTWYEPQSSVTTVYVYPQSTISTIYVYPPQPVTSTITEYVSVDPTTTSDTPRITFYPPRNAEPEAEPQTFGLGPPSRTVQEAPTPPLPWWWIWPAETPTETIDRVVNEKREPQGLGPVSRTVQEGPTPPLPWWWIWPTETPTETIYRSVDEKREPQTLDFGSRTVEGAPPSTTLDWTFWDPPHHPGHRVTTTKPYEIDATATLSMLTIRKKREPQSLGPISRTNEITPVGPTGHHHSSTAVSTVYITVTQFPPDPTSTPHHHPHSVSTISTVETIETIETIIYSTTDSVYAPSPTDTVIETITLPFVINTPTPLAKEKRIAEAEPEPQFPQSLTLGWPATATYSPSKENPCQNNIFAPPAWCFSPTRTSVVTVIVTETGTIFENTATLAPITFTDQGWRGRKDKKSRQREEKQEEEEMERRQQILDTQTRTFTYAAGTTSVP